MSNRATALMDWDNTLRPGFTILDWSRFLCARKLFAATAMDDLHATVDGYAAGLVSYNELGQKAAEYYGSGLQGVDAKAVAEAAFDFVADDRPQIFSFAEGVHQFFAQHHISSIVISGAPIEVLEAYQSVFGWEEVYGTSIVVENEVYSGDVATNLANGVAKAELVRQVRPDRRIILAFGDSDADIPLLDVADYKIIVDSADVLPDASDVIRVSSTVEPSDLVSKLTEVLPFEVN